MTFVTDKLQEFIDEKKKQDGITSAGAAYKVAYEEGLRDAYQVVRRAEAELEQRIWQAWVNEGVQPT